MLKKEKGRLIVIEGTDGSGKKTQLDLLLGYLTKKNISHTSFDFPQYGKTFFGDFAGRFLNGEFGHFSRINPYLASFPYAADRWQVKDKLWKAIDNNKFVICNRYTPSVVYQAAKVKPAKRKTFLNWVETMEYKIFGIPKPDLVIFLYMPLIFSQRLIARKNKDQYEESPDYLQKVEKIYLATAKSNKHWVKIDCIENEKILPPEIISQKIIDKLFLC